MAYIVMAYIVMAYIVMARSHVAIGSGYKLDWKPPKAAPSRPAAAGTVPPIVCRPAITFFWAATTGSF